MTEGRLNLPEDLLSSKLADDRSSVKDQAWRGKSSTDDKTVAGLTDESKDQMGSDNSTIPLSPQWLYVKPVDAKPGEVRAPNSSSDGIVKDSWRLDGSQEKKDWRRNGLDVEGGRRWREEERDTGLLGRRERRKEDHRSDGVSTRDASDGRSFSSSSSDRWHESNNRTLGHDSRRDSKWSSRWGPEDKEKDSRNEKRIEAEKEDTHTDKQSFVNGNRTTSERENETREKWRPRHLMELHGGASAAHRSIPAPGFGSERGRVEGTYVGFAGRGRSNNNGSIQIGRHSSASPIGSVPGDKNNAYCYPRAKLLDIYRKQKNIPSFSERIPDGLELASPMTQEVAVRPLAFVTPDAEEEAALRHMWLRKITSGELLSVRDMNTTLDNNSSGFCQGNKSFLDKADEITEPFGKLTVGRYCQGNGAEVSDMPMSEETGHCGQDASFSLKPASLKNDFSRASECAPADDITKSNEFVNQQQSPSISHLPIESCSEGPHLGAAVLPEELSLCYLDPQGTIQGPYLGIDIITWFEQGYFGTDLPVRLSDALDGSPFCELGELMPQLKIKSGSASNSIAGPELQTSEIVGGGLDKSTRAPATPREDQQWAASDTEAVSSVNGQSTVPNHDFLSSIRSIEDQRFQNSVAQDEEFFFPGKPRSSSNNLLTRHAGDIQNLSNPSRHLSLTNEFSEPAMSLHQDECVHPFGLRMSEVTGNLDLKHTQLSKVAAGIGDQGHHMERLFGKDTAFPNDVSPGAVADQAPYTDTWPDDFERKKVINSNIPLGSIDTLLSHRGQELNDFELQQLMIQKFQKEQEQQPLHPLSNATGLGVEAIPLHLSELQFQQQQQLELQQQHHLELQQQHHLELQQQHHLELQKQGQLELQQQKHELELRQQWQLELQQQRQLELQQQQRQLELQQQHRLMQQQQEQQQLHLYKMKLLQQQQQRQQQQQHQHHQQQQMLLELLARQQISDLGYSPLKVDPMRENLLDQVQFRMQQNSLPSRHLDPSLEQILYSQFGHGPHGTAQEPQPDLVSLMKPGSILPSDQRLHCEQEQLQAQQLSLALKQHLGMEGERHFGGPWSLDASHRHQPSQTAGFNSFDSYQQPQRLSPQEENLSHHNWNHPLQEQPQHGFYERSSIPFERQLSLPSVASGIKLDNVNGHLQDSDLAERNLYLKSAEQPSSFSSGLPSLRRQVSENFYASHPNVMDAYISGNNGQIENNRIEEGMQASKPEGERRRKVPEAAANSSLWQATGGNEETSKQVLGDLTQKVGAQSSQLTEDEYWHRFSSRSGENHWPLTESYSSIAPLNRRQDQDVAMSNSFTEGSQTLNSSFLLQDNLDSMARNSQSNHLGNGERLTLRPKSKSGALIEDQAFLLGTKDPSHKNYVDCSLIGKLSVDNNLPEVDGKGKRNGSESLIAMGRPFRQTEENLVEQAESITDFGELTINANSRHSSRHSSISSAGGNGGLYNYEVGLEKSSGEVVSSDRLPSILSKGLDGGLHRRPPVSRAASSHNVLSDLASVSHIKQKTSANLATTDERRHESAAKIAGTLNSEEQASSQKQVLLRRSASDATVSEASSFIDALKKPVIFEVDAVNMAAWESTDGSQGGQNNKKKVKKGKKGRQIDPALLGFKVSSNRIMMGEIQGLDD